MMIYKHIHKTGATDSRSCRGCLQEEHPVKHVILQRAGSEEPRITMDLRGLLGRNRLSDPSEFLEKCFQRPKVQYFQTPFLKKSKDSFIKTHPLLTVNLYEKDIKAHLA